MFNATVIQDSIAPHGVRLISVQTKFPRFILAELNTHRVFSKSAGSSRAIPVEKLLEQVRTAPAMPVHWGKNQPGMQAREELHPSLIGDCERIWREAAEAAANYAEILGKGIGAHKQVANRLIEPFVWVPVIITSTEWANFYELRDHEDADPTFYHLVHEFIRPAIENSTPTFRPRDRMHHSAWHLPYITEMERTTNCDPRILAKLSAARCARVSYMNHDGKIPSVEKDLALYETLVGSRPRHSGPVEHQGYPLPVASQWNKNLRGWRQHRDVVEVEAECDALALANSRAA